MATNKLIKPTNVTVSIPAFTDQPDQRVNSNCIDKSIDGINALSDQIANSTVESVGPTSGLTCRYLIRSGFCYCHINGTPTSTANITFTVPKALVASNKTEGQWGSTSNMVQVWIDANSTTLTVRNHNTTSFNAFLIYPVA